MTRVYFVVRGHVVILLNHYYRKLVIVLLCPETLCKSLDFVCEVVAPCHVVIIASQIKYHVIAFTNQ